MSLHCITIVRLSYNGSRTCHELAELRIDFFHNRFSPALRLIVCERTGEWTAGLRIELVDSSVKVWECRRLAEAWSGS